MNINKLLYRSKKIIAKKNLYSSDIDAEILLSHILNVSREYVLIHPELEISKEEESRFMDLVERRSQGEPVAYLTEYKEFCGLEFEVNKNTLVPRPETEILVEKTLDYIENNFNKKDKLRIFDIGTGSGCIITAIAQELKNLGFSNVGFCAGDISKAALNTARKNTQNHLEKQEIIFKRGDLLNPFIEEIKGFGEKDQLIILANLPYLSETIYQNSPGDVRNFEPKLALEAGKDGLDYYKRLLDYVKEYDLDKKTGSTCLFLEISPEQAEKIKEVVKDNFPESEIEIYKDLAERDRIVRILNLE
ncbi:MAG: peptide chain release factor N(5)-glutamine methyltransferase [Candidatus Moraniibacteriota bacterium]